MDTKLTLKLDREIIEEAKKYAREKNISLSKLIESYLETGAPPRVGTHYPTGKATFRN